jgi:hypothetical protein
MVRCGANVAVTSGDIAAVAALAVAFVPAGGGARSRALEPTACARNAEALIHAERRAATPLSSPS